MKLGNFRGVVAPVGPSDSAPVHAYICEINVIHLHK